VCIAVLESIEFFRAAAALEEVDSFAGGLMLRSEEKGLCSCFISTGLIYGLDS
jgi:hypothetical protein